VVLTKNFKIHKRAGVFDKQGGTIPII